MTHQKVENRRTGWDRRRRDRRQKDVSVAENRRVATDRRFDKDRRD